ncbi:ferric siderophore ABC transporter substrate-binding protein [Chryseobacterium sp.]|uniref:ferric siderophore ABC transporter substrate-binding protein n=1 Tax=Chryseobacterium sp. TaxID=1871047 RepID=UPI00388E204A
MSTYSVDRNENNKDKIKSGIISVAIWSAILLFVFIYKLQLPEVEKQPEVITTMLVNFGDNRNAVGIEEPAPQEGSVAAGTEEKAPVPVETKVTEPEVIAKPEPKPIEKKPILKDKVITGTNKNTTATKKTETKADKTTKTSTASTTNKTNAKTSASTSNAKAGNGDGKGNAAIGNLIKGRGTKAGSQGTGAGIGNNGDPLGGDGDGDSKVGIDRKLVGYIPGTMGRGGAQPSHSCKAGGSITISYTVDKSGNVSSARRQSGVSDPCVVSTSISWVKKYVKAEKATTSSTGSYKISF